MSQVVHMTTWTRVQQKMIILCCVGPNHFIILFPGRVAVKAASTTKVLPRMQEMHREKVMLKAVCRSMQDQDVGSPINTKAHRKHRVSDNKIKKTEFGVIHTDYRGTFVVKKYDQHCDSQKCSHYSYHSQGDSHCITGEKLNHLWDTYCSIHIGPIIFRA